MKRANSLLYNITLLISDFTALLLSFIGAYIIRVKIDDRSLVETVAANEYALIIALLLGVWIFIFALLGLYRTSNFDNRIREAALLLVGSVIGIQFLISAEYILDRAIFPARLVVVYGLALSFILTLFFRTLIRIIFRFRYRAGRGVTNLLVVGNTNITDELLLNLQNQSGGYKVVGVVANRRTTVEHLSDNKHFATFEQAIETLHTPSIHAIIQTELYSDEQKNDEILTFAQTNHIGYRFVPGNSKLFVGNLEVELFQNIPTISVHQTPLTGWGRIFKRLFDFSVGVIVTIFALPFLALIWLMITIIGDGKAVFRQTRLSRYNSKIKLFKFRTHVNGLSGLTPEEAFTKLGKPELAKEYRANGDRLDNDPRVSKIGKFLRKTSLDELPQLFNVLKGDLSLVGPRPLVPEEMDYYKKKNVILSVKPGITGLAVVSGRKNIDFEERRRLDMYYAQNWSFLLDVIILGKTFAQVLNRIFSNEND